MSHINALTHLAIIPDGNRRWAIRRGLPTLEGHRAASELLKKIVIDWCFLEFGIKYVTVFVMSTENFEKRSEKELDDIFALIRSVLLDFMDDQEIHQNKIRIQVIGDKDRFPEYLQETIRKIDRVTGKYDCFVGTLAIVYGGKQEILSAVKKIIDDAIEGKVSSHQMNEKLFRKYLYMGDAPDPDLIIRTSEYRLSNFLLWQMAYSQICFVDKLFPDLDKNDLVKILSDFARTKKRYGK